MTEKVSSEQLLFEALVFEKMRNQGLLENYSSDPKVQERINSKVSEKINSLLQSEKFEDFVKDFRQKVQEDLLRIRDSLES